MKLGPWAAGTAALALAAVAVAAVLVGVSPPLVSLQAIIIPCLVALGYLVRPRGRPTAAPAWGSSLAVAAFGLALLGFHQVGWDRLGLALVPLGMLLSFSALWGWRQAWAHAPLWSCAWVALLLTPGLVEGLDDLLMTVTTQVSTAGLQLAGFDAHADGHTVMGLRIPIYVTEACAGTTLSAGAYTLGVVLASLLVQRSTWRAALGVAFIGVSFVVNVLRIIVVSTVAGLLGREAALTAHDGVGYVMAAVGYGLLAVMVVLTRRAERRSGAPADPLDAAARPA